MDQEFDKVVGKMPEIEVNTATARENVREIERGVGFIKKRCRGTRDIMPFKQIPKASVIHLGSFVVWINFFPAMQDISKNYPHVKSYLSYP